MTYKEFLKLANERAADGRWSLQTCVICTEIASALYNIPWYKRKKFWKENKFEEIIKCIGGIE